MRDDMQRGLFSARRARANSVATAELFAAEQRRVFPLAQNRNRREGGKKKGETRNFAF